jgi:transposase
VKLLPPQHVRPYVRRNKTDRADAAALLEADRCPDILAVPVKSGEQQGLQGLHRVRSAWMATRTDRINTLRGLLREFGLALPQGPAAVLERAPALVAEGDGAVPPALRTALAELVAEIRSLQTRIADLEKQLREQAKQRPDVQRLLAVPGIGLLIATALVAAVGGMEAFRDGRHLGPISKRGDRYLRMLFIHGARAALLAAQHRQGAGQPLTRLQQWALDLAVRVGHNKAACALANKLARIAFAVVRQGRAFDGDFVPAKAS